jgi:hypothetical protein
MRPGFDDTGILVGGLVVAGIGAVLLAGSPSIGRAWVLGVLVGGPTPILEILNGGQAASLAALVIALAGALGAAAVLRAVGHDR